ncbi:MAG: signal peptidase II [Proteobacteria bacterium]|nr:signal peptidase II [Pseudomonadota bacterium]
MKEQQQLKDHLIKYLAVVIIIVLAIVFDQWTKNWAEENLATPRFPEHTVSVQVQNDTTLEQLVQERYAGNSEHENKLIMANAYRSGERLMPQTNITAGQDVEFKYVGLTVIDGYYDYQYARNPGAAFSFLADQSPEFRSAFFGITGIIAVILMLVFIITGSWKTQKPMILALTFILGGAVGNIIDRIRFGYVIDFISWHVENHYWPTFNIADVFVTGGVAFLVLDLLIQAIRSKTSPKAIADASGDENSEASNTASDVKHDHIAGKIMPPETSKEPDKEADNPEQKDDEKPSMEDKSDSKDDAKVSA